MKTSIVTHMIVSTVNIQCDPHENSQCYPHENIQCYPHENRHCYPHKSSICDLYDIHCDNLKMFFNCIYLHTQKTLHHQHAMHGILSAPPLLKTTSTTEIAFSYFFGPHTHTYSHTHTHTHTHHTHAHTHAVVCQGDNVLTWSPVKA